MTTSITFASYGPPKVLTVTDETAREPESGEVRIVNRAIAVNPFDWKIVAGKFKDNIKLTLPAVPGGDSAGVVDAVGPDVEGFAVGDLVIRSGTVGAFRAVAVVPAKQLTLRPASVPDEQAASIPTAGGTAWATVEQINVGPDDTVLIHAAAGGVGSTAVQIAVARGARVIGTASARNHDDLRALGAEPVEYGEGLADRVRALGQITASIDTIGGAEAASVTHELLGDNPRAVTTAHDEHAEAAGIPAVKRGPGAIAAVLKLVDEGKVTFEIAERLPLTEAAQAFELSYGGHVRGKLILVP